MNAIGHLCCPVHGSAPGATLSLVHARTLKRALARQHETAPELGPVPQEALDYFDSKGIEPGFNFEDVWAEEHAFAFTVAKEMRLDVLTDIRDGISEALREGKSFQSFRRDLTPLLVQHGWGEKVVDKDGEERVVVPPHRLKLIFLTNMRVARAVGHWERIQRTKEARPFLLYRIGPSNNHRPQHVSWNGVLLPADDPFWATHFPPNGYGCKCFTRQLSVTAAERLGGVTIRPDMTPVEHLVGGEVVLAPVGIDPGWDFNPGIERKKAAA